MLLLKTFADESQSSRIASDDFKISLNATAQSKRTYATFVLNDADMLHALPFFKVNPEIRPLLDRMGVTEATIEHLLGCFVCIITKDENVNLTRHRINQFIQDETGHLMENSLMFARDNITDVPGQVYDIARQLHHHRENVNNLSSPDCL